ncbi:MAG: hypothetical protein HY537_01515 [Deltaproteobacteria bacterium]|nr:hypothetical protein [Deltaproteobacteria bacterium]
MHWQNTLDELDRLIREGHAQSARRKLFKLCTTKIPRSVTLPLASLARRVRLAGQGIRLLNPFVRSTRKAPADASDAERVEYGACLLGIGATEEALNLFRQFDARKMPDVLLYEAFALVTQWDYAGSIPLLTTYLQNPQLSDYQRLVGKTNLAAACVHEKKLTGALALLETLIQETHRANLLLLQGYCLQLLAQGQILQQKWSAARQSLSGAASVLKDAGTLDEFFVRKWQAVLEVSKNGPRSGSLIQLRKVASEARALGHWETQRDCELVEATVTRNKKLALYLHFGTPYPAFRSRIISEMGPTFRIPSEFVWDGSLTANARTIIDLKSGKLPNGSGLKVGQTLHRLLVALCTDFYRPLRVAPLHYLLYPDEFYNPLSSPMRVHQAIKRLKIWFHQTAIPLTVEENNGTYRLVQKGSCAISIPRDKACNSLKDYSLSLLRTGFKQTPFTAADAQNALNISRMSVLRLLQAATRAGTIQRTGTGSVTSYRFIR